MGKWLLAIGLGAGCHDAGPAIANAAINTAIAVAASGVQRSRGGCYAVCIDFTVCNPGNGLCERRTCSQGCGSTQFCNRSGTEPTCEERKPIDVPLQPTVTPPPTAPPASTVPLR